MSTNFNNNLVPQLDADIEIYPFNNSEYLIQHKTLGHQININSKTHSIIELVDGNRTIQEISEALKSENNLPASPEFIYEILYNQLSVYGIIKNEIIAEKRSRSRYLKLSFILIPENVLSHLTPFFTFLFKRWIFFVLLTACLIFISTMIIVNFSLILLWVEIKNVATLDFIIYLILFQVGTLLHEFGHAVACKSFGAKHGGIGFGFYLLTPALFTDVSDAWRLKRGERIIVNLGGIYFELLIASFFLLFYFDKHTITFLILPCILIINTLKNLNPFLKLDGYWILSDATNKPNLQKNAFRILNEKFRQFRKLKFSFDNTQEGLMFLYALISTSFIFIFLGSILIYDPYSTISFPYDLFRYIKNWQRFEIGSFQRFILPLMFWYLLISFILKNYSKVKTLISSFRP
ncbi:MAG: hypothetical protein ORN54_08380 [Cyclobacteriaceae bacterium]|nr:hypothetical protein [Cyclobacteriaceae bacterium]